MARPLTSTFWTLPSIGDLVHVDVKKLGKVPPGGGWRVHGRAARPGRHRRIGYCFVHSAVDDHSRLAYSEIHDDEQAVTAVGFWRRASALFAGHGIAVRAVLTDNRSCYRSQEWMHELVAGGAVPRRTRPYRPQTNGKVERFNRTLLDEWAYVRAYASEADRRRRLDSWLHTYNHHRCHTALGGQPPVARVGQPAWVLHLAGPALNDGGVVGEVPGLPLRPHPAARRCVRLSRG